MVLFIQTRKLLAFLAARHVAAHVQLAVCQDPQSYFPESQSTPAFIVAQDTFSPGKDFGFVLLKFNEVPLGPYVPMGFYGLSFPN